VCVPGRARPGGDGPGGQSGQPDAPLGQPDPAAEEIKEMLGEIDPNRITPVEALMKLAEMKETLAD
jgi:DNA mismatch repair protein MutS